MMTDKDISQEEVNHLIEDAAYLQDEADAMQYVIEDVPYNESPPDQQSIAEMLLLVDHAQTSYYRSIFEDAVDSKRPTHVEEFSHFRESFELDGEVDDILKVLRKISKHRAGVVNALKEISLIDWSSSVYKDGNEISLYDFIRQMIRFERGVLKDIADRVMVYSKEQESRREIEHRRKRQNKEQSNNNSHQN